MKTLKKLSLFLIWNLLAALVLVSGAFSKSFNIGTDPVKIGVLAKRGTHKALKKWGATAEYLSRQIPGHQFVIVPLGFSALKNNVVKEEVDFLITNSGYYVLLEDLYGLSRIATLRNRWQNEGYQIFGGVVFTRAENTAINGFKDLKNSRFIAVDSNSFGGWLMARFEFHKSGIDPETHFKTIVFAGTHDEVVMRVLNKTADAGTVRTDTLERMAAEGSIKISNFKIIGSKPMTRSFPFLRSTQLYPEWPFAKLSHTPDDLSRQVTIALLNLPSQSPAAIHARITGWTVPMDYRPVHNLMKELKIGQYQALNEISLMNIIRKYWMGIAVPLIFIAAIAGTLFYVLLLNKKLKSARLAVERTNELLEDKVRQRTQELTASEQKHRIVADNTYDWELWRDPEGQFIYCSPSCEAITGYEHNEFIDNPDLITALIHPDDLLRYKNHREKEKARSTVRKIEFRIIDRSGKERWIEHTCKPIFNQDNYLGCRATNRDITEQKRNEEIKTVCLELSEFSYSHTTHEILTKFLNEAERLTKSKIGFFHFVEPSQDALSLQTWSTNTMAHMCTTEPERVHYPISEAGVWADAVRERQPVIHNDYPSLPHRKGLPKGHAGVVRQLVVPIFRKNKVVAVLGVGNKPTDYDQKDVKTVTNLADASWDIVLKKRAEADLHESEEKYRSIMESMDDCTFICTLDFKVAYMNPAMIKRIGRNCTGENCFKAIHGVDKVCPWCDLDKVMKGNSAKTEIKSPLDGQDYNILSSPLYHAHGAISKLSVLRNVTEVKTMGKRLQQAQKMEAIGSLAGGIAHDFNNILFPIVGMAEMLIEDLPKNSQEQLYAKQIFIAGQRASALVRQILAFSRQTEHVVIPIKIQLVLKEVLKLCRSSIPPDIEITDVIQKDCGLVKADFTQIHQVAMNLITNAYHAVKEKHGKISVLLKEFKLSQDDFPGSYLKPGRYIQFTVSDTGCGIEPGVMDKIFDPYFTTKRKGEGTGLGLATVYEIVRECQGEIKVYSEIGKGSTFNVYLPVTLETDVTELVSKTETLQTGAERILLIDDEKPIVEIEKAILERLGYHVTSFTNSIEALKAFHSNPEAYDMVISDMAMPKMTGDLLSKELREIRSDIPILICTGFNEMINKKKIETIGVDGILMKPIARTELSKSIREILNKKK